MSKRKTIRDIIGKYIPEQIDTGELEHELSALTEGATIPIRELEDLLLVVRDLKSRYETQANSTVGDVFRMDELKQLEFKLTEHLFNNRK